MNYILYCAIHKKNLVYETLYSMLTLKNKITSDKDTKIVLCTNFANEFYKEAQKNNLDIMSDIIVEEIDNRLVESWIYHGFAYTIKIYIIKYFFEKYKDNVLFIDSDMYILQDVTPLFSIISNKEFVMFDSQCDVFTTFAENMVTFDALQCLLSFNKDAIQPFDVHYRSGILGIHYCFKDIIDEILLLAKQIYMFTRIHTSEEIAFACVLQKYGKVYTSERYFNHYSQIHFVRILIGYIFHAFFDDDERRFHDWLNFYNLDIEFVNQTLLSYDDLTCFLYIFHAYVHNKRFHHVEIFPTLPPYADRERYQAILKQFDSLCDSQEGATGSP